MSMYEIDLSQFDDDFRAEQIEERGEFEPIPDGKYQVVVERVELTKSQTSGNPMIKWTLRILAPKFQGRLLWRNSVISQNTLKYIKTDLHVCGVDLEKLSDLPQYLSRLLDVKLEITKRTKGDSENIYFNRRIETSPKASTPGSEADDDFLPF